MMTSWNIFKKLEVLEIIVVVISKEHQVNQVDLIIYEQFE